VTDTPQPLLLGSDAEFASLRSALAAAGFTESAVCWRMNLKRISDFPSNGKPPEGVTPTDPLGALIWLVMYCAPVEASIAERLPVAELEALGIVRRQDGRVIANVMLFPQGDLWLASDRPAAAKAPGQGFDDFVYPAIVPNTTQFLDYLPEVTCDAFLEVCAGAAPAALRAAKHGARHAWAFDLTARSTHFAEFNRRLNGIANLTAAQGDLYQPAGGLTFDCIVAHPPYVPLFGPGFIFDQGGPDGEQVVRGLIEGLPKHLRPGGRFYALTSGSDREQPFEVRVRQWLGDSHTDFDVALAARSKRGVEDYTSEVVLRRNGSMEDLRGWRGLLKDLGVRQFVYGFLMVQRRAGKRPVFTVRRHAGPRASAPEHAWLLDWETALARDGDAQVMNRKIRTNPGARLHTEFRLTNDGWVPDDFEVRAEHPLFAELKAQAWTAHLLASADGSVTAAELLEKLKAAGTLRADTDRAGYANFVATLVSFGLLELL
jgi:hypothetical protein